MNMVYATWALIVAIGHGIMGGLRFIVTAAAIFVLIWLIRRYW